MPGDNGRIGVEANIGLSPVGLKNSLLVFQ